MRSADLRTVLRNKRTLVINPKKEDLIWATNNIQKHARAVSFTIMTTTLKFTDVSKSLMKTRWSDS